MHVTRSSCLIDLVFRQVATSSKIILFFWNLGYMATSCVARLFVLSYVKRCKTMPFIVSCGGVVCSTAVKAVLCMVTQPSSPSGAVRDEDKERLWSRPAEEAFSYWSHFLLVALLVVACDLIFWYCWEFIPRLKSNENYIVSRKRIGASILLLSYVITIK